MGVGEKLKKLITSEDEEEQLVLTQQESEVISPYEKGTIQSNTITANTNIVLFEPRNFAEAQEIGEHLKNKRACCVNLHKMPSEYKQRVTDFLSGVVFGINGYRNKIGDGVILFSPQNLKVGGDIHFNASEEEE